MKAIRGAITVKENTPDAIRESTLELLEEIIASNALRAEQMVNITFTATKDLDAAYPTKYARELPGFDEVPLFCVQEMNVEGALPLCIRAMVLTEQPVLAAVHHVYLHGAEILRPDLIKNRK